jgi:hypothetical protein
MTYTDNDPHCGAPIQRTYTAEEVAHLIALAYESGRHAALTESMAETWRNFEVNWRDWRRTAAQTLADRRAAIDAGAARAATSPTPYEGGPVAWEDTDGTGGSRS